MQSVKQMSRFAFPKVAQNAPGRGRMFVRQLVQSDSHQDAAEQTESPEEELYPGHIRTTPLQKALLGVGSTLMALYSPARDDMVAVNGEVTGMLALPWMHRKMLEDAEGQQILREKPKLNSYTVDLDALRSLPEGTLGRAYTQFLDVNGVSPDTRLPVRFVDDPELAYVMQRYREAHDLMHTVLGMNTKLVGEVAVKWVEGLQTGLPMCLGGALMAPIRFRPKQRKDYVTRVLPWALKNGFKGKFILNAYFEKRWSQDLNDFRKEFNIQEPPSA